MSILIKNALVNNREQDIYVEGNTIARIGKNLKERAEHKIDGEHKAALPGFFNSHTHAAMTLFRGYADDMKLQEWLETKIWPLEAKLTEKDVYVGTKLACLEMIRSGTTFFNDMYWHWHGTAKAVEEMGIRAAVSAVFIDLFNKEKAEEQIRLNERLFKESRRYSQRIIFALGPHTIYTVSKESLQWAKDFADKNNLLLHIHLSETKKEVDDCIKKHKKSPVEYLESIGFLGPNVVACHSVWLNHGEIATLARHKVKVVHNPTSNMKLAVGAACKFGELRNAGATVALGTDGCASNNNLDMFEEMKIAALLQKFATNEPVAMAAREVFEMATLSGARVFGINAGAIKEGSLADLLLINLKIPELCPHHDLMSNLVYSANGSCVDTTICDGKILMLDRRVDGEEAIMEQAEQRAKELIHRN
jgi:5-methylthioadenosine/S-adenosylhomocysteine deaminase